MDTSTWPPRIMLKDSELSKVAAPGTRVTVSFPALTMSLREARLDIGDQGCSGHSRIDFLRKRVVTHAENPVLGLDPDLLPGREKRWCKCGNAWRGQFCLPNF